MKFHNFVFQGAEVGLVDRLIMLKILFQRDPRISIGLSNRGLFIEKLKPLRKLYPSSTRLTFIVGFDTILRVMDEKYYRNRGEALDRLFSQCEFLVASREDHEEDAFEELFKKGVNKRYRHGVSFFTLPAKFSFYSSSQVRKNRREGKPINHLVHIPILRFIEEKRVYTP